MLKRGAGKKKLPMFQQKSEKMVQEEKITV